MEFGTYPRGAYSISEYVSVSALEFLIHRDVKTSLLNLPQVILGFLQVVFIKYFFEVGMDMILKFWQSQLEVLLVKDYLSWVVLIVKQMLWRSNSSK